ncbi:MAG: hypothetical protein ICV85_22485 [Tolypothrix sp. T3-bin4]|nr:hypothetical protein [Tolypothrix sp. T3-bin4]
MNFESTGEILTDSLNTKEYSFQTYQCESIYLKPQHSDLEQIKESVKHWATLLETTYNWAEVVIEFMKLPEEFRCEVWEVWQKIRFPD